MTKKKKLGGGGWGGRGIRIIEIFFTKNQNLKKRNGRGGLE